MNTTQGNAATSRTATNKGQQAIRRHQDLVAREKTAKGLAASCEANMKKARTDMRFEDAAYWLEQRAKALDTADKLGRRVTQSASALERAGIAPPPKPDAAAA